MIELTSKQRRAAYKKAWNQANREKHNASNKLWRDENKEYIAVYKKTWRENHKDKQNLYNKLWKKLNPEKVNAQISKRRSAKLNRIPKWLNLDALREIENLYKLAIDKTKETGIKWHVDHIIPLQGKIVSGLHVPANLQVIPAVENLKKNNKFTNYIGAN
jgi:hypothetical protein